MMQKPQIKKTGLMLAAWLASGMLAVHAGQPLKVFVLAGQSNMQGKARVSTIERLNMPDEGNPLDKDSKQLYRDMVGEDGQLKAVQDAYCVYYTEGNGLEVSAGPLVPGLGETVVPKTGFGPEYTFGLTMRKHLKEPILIIKTAWGGKDLIQKFRPPSAGPYPLSKKKIEQAKARGNLNAVVEENRARTGRYYRLMIEHVNEVLADPGKYHPAYNEADGYEIEGFVWFQGWNDLVGPYPSKGKTKDYSEYSRLLATFIRDVRVDLEVPELPFVIGVIGVDGELEPGDKQSLFREAMAAPASMDAFKDNVVAEATAPYWDMKLQQVLDKREQGMRQLVIAEHPELESRPRALSNEVGRNREELLPKVLTPEEIEFVQMAQSNASFHYNGSAYTYGLIGKAFAEALVELKK